MGAGKFVFNIAVGFVPDLAIAWGYMKLTEGGSREFWIAVTALQCVYLFLWFKRTTWAWIVFILYGRRETERTIGEYLEKSQFPRPDQSDVELSDYLSETMRNQTLPVETRLRASLEFGVLKGLWMSGHLTAALMVNIASRRAIAKYSRRVADEWTTSIHANYKPVLGKTIPVGIGVALGLSTLFMEIYAADNFGERVSESLPFLRSIPFFPFGLLLVVFCICFPVVIGVFACNWVRSKRRAE